MRIETAAETRTVEVDVRGEGALAWEGEPPVRIEVDPLRLYLDPVRSNGVWKR